MSTIIASNLQASGGTGTAATLASINGGPIAGSRQRLINGDMRIDQRNAGAAVTMSNPGIYDVDRWYCTNASDGVMTAQQISDAPAGFVNSIRCTTTTADASLGTSQRAVVAQMIEGFNVADLGWGAAGAATITLSFWVKSSLTGTFGGALRNSAADRSYPFTYSINSANTWEQKSITISGDTTGTWLKDNGVGVSVNFGLGVASNLSGTAGAWAAANNLSATGATSVLGTLNATWQITGVQLEAGTVATPFERRSYGQELMLSQRYFQRYATTGNGPYCTFSANATTNARCAFRFPTMRAAPSFSFSAAGSFYVQISGSNIIPSAVTAAVVGSTDLALLDFTCTGLSANIAGTILDNTGASSISLSAEL